MTTRKGDAPTTQSAFRQVRRGQTTYGAGMSVLGIALLVWFPGSEWVRIGVGAVVLLLGGMMVNPQVVRELLGIVAEFVPLLRSGKK